MQQQSDRSEWMILAFNKGDEVAYDYFFRSFIDDLYAYGRSLRADEATTKDIIQDVFLSIFSSNIKFQSSEHLKYYLLRSIKNKLIDLYKSIHYKTTTSLDVNDILPFDLHISIESEILDNEEQQILKQRVEKIFSVLTDKQKEVVYLRYLKNMKYEEISKSLDISEVSVRKIVSRAVMKMREANEFSLAILLVYSCFIR